MPWKRRRASSAGGTDSDNDSETEDETTSKVTRGMGESLGPLKRRRTKNRDLEDDVVDMTSALGLWATSLKGPHLDLMVSLKRLSEVRLMNTGEESLACCLTPEPLRTIGIILEGLIKDRISMEYAIDMGLRKGYDDAQAQENHEGITLPRG